jgi:3-keto-L-gulonate-6-phosphate decarboxylase
MKLQIEFDIADLDKALNIAKSVEKYCDFFQIGTLLLYKYGELAITSFKSEFQSKPLVIDAKITTKPKELINFLASIGADYITILGGIDRNTIHAATSTAHELGKKIILDLIDASYLGQIALEAKSLGVDALLFHKTENEPMLFLDHWEMVKGNTQLPILINGNVTRENIDQLLPVGASTIIVGSSITKAPNPEEEAIYFASIIKQQSIS